jgi:hypothetical protein
MVKDRMEITRAEAIKLQCIECFGYQKNMVSKCTDMGCPLFPFRLGPGRTEQIDTPVRTGK